MAAIALAGLGVRSAQAEEATVHRTSSPGGVLLRDTITGGVLGSAVAGGIIAYQMGVKDKSNYDWGRTLAWGAGIGLGVGLIWGVVDAATGSYADRTIASAHDGLSRSLDVATRDQSGRTQFPVVLGRF